MENKQEKINGGEIVVQNRFVKWLDNFWYHHKWTVIVISFFVLTFAVCFVQCAKRENEDAMVSVAVGYTLSGKEQEAFIQVINAVAPKKIGTDAGLRVSLTTYSIYTEDVLRQMYTDPDGKLSTAAYNNAKQVSADHDKNYGTFLMTGECAVHFVSPYVYESKNMSQLARPLSELYDAIPESAYDGYAIRLADTEFYQYYDAVKCLPADTLIVLTRPYVWGTSSDDTAYQDFEALYRAIVEFKAP